MSRPILATRPLPYPTTSARGGAAHPGIGPTLGAVRDLEIDGVPSAAADADGADEDGVAFAAYRVGQFGAELTVDVGNAPGGALLDAWFDFNGDGSWGGAGERIAAGLAVSEGPNVIAFNIPSEAASGTTFARFRLSTAGASGPGGVAVDGEVEDYAVTLLPPVEGSSAFYRGFGRSG